MAKKKELPKAMMGKFIKPVVRAVAATGRVATKATVRGKNAYNTSAKFSPSITQDIKAAGKGFVRGVKSETKTEIAKAAERKLAAQKANKKVKEWPSLDGSSSTKTKGATNNKTKEWPSLDGSSTKTGDKTKPAKEPMSPQKKKRIKQAAVVGTVAAAGAIKYANRDRRRLND